MDVSSGVGVKSPAGAAEAVDVVCSQAVLNSPTLNLWYALPEQRLRNGSGIITRMIRKRAHYSRPLNHREVICQHKRLFLPYWYRLSAELHGTAQNCWLACP
jgi:hypothetical protein